MSVGVEELLLEGRFDVIYLTVVIVVIELVKCGMVMRWIIREWRKRED